MQRPPLPSTHFRRSLCWCFRIVASRLLTQGECGWKEEEEAGAVNAATKKLARRMDGAAVSAGRVRAIITGRNSTYVLQADGDVLVCGSNKHGMLALGEEADKKENVALLRTCPALSALRVERMAAGQDFMVVHTRDRRTLTCGYGSSSQLGVPNLKSTHSPVEVPILTGETVVSLACGVEHTAVITAKNELLTWGSNKYGCLGFGDTVQHNVPDIVPMVALLADGDVMAQVQCAAATTYVLTKQGKIYAAGDGGKS